MMSDRLRTSKAVGPRARPQPRTTTDAARRTRQVDRPEVAYRGAPADERTVGPIRMVDRVDVLVADVIDRGCRDVARAQRDEAHHVRPAHARQLTVARNTREKE